MKWMKNPRTLCIGRFVIDIPTEMQLKTDEYHYAGHELRSTPSVMRYSFDHIVNERVAVLLSKKRKDYSGKTVLLTDIPWLETNMAIESNSRLLVYNETSRDRLRLSYMSEGYVWSNDTLLFATPLTSFEMIEDAIDVAKDVLPRVSGRLNTEISTKPGFCFDGGLVKGLQKYNESVTAYFERPSTLGGMIFGIETRPTVKVDDKLLDRKSFFVQALGKLIGHTSTIRDGERTVAGMDGQEWLLKVTAGAITAYNFVWEFKGQIANDGEPMHVTQPHAYLQLRVGGETRDAKTNARQTSALTEQEALDLWEALLQGTRLRPNAA
ncbi:T6SS immunity protein Tli4 family protein [Glaciimonas sp. PAMC28666]|uniref:T6SS immunity protein Tli4 family protein n=1 Tax=Glaciimonas sp. PAMC28666 TaxID=2807626 RepID=UPI0019649B9D|nr:T6SS immunity protein Tli4 family protein [Glaciimonas sp. PAMC28666]QRX84026.1 hypothetical protein JQN73_07435 [Glaciimonas sp. PAMC28666]